MRESELSRDDLAELVWQVSGKRASWLRFVWVKDAPAYQHRQGREPALLIDGQWVGTASLSREQLLGLWEAILAVARPIEVPSSCQDMGWFLGRSEFRWAETQKDGRGESGGSCGRQRGSRAAQRRRRGANERAGAPRSRR